MTNGDVKSVQGDTGHAEAEMVTDVYSKIIDEDRRFNAQKMDREFYSTLNDDMDNQQQHTGLTDSDIGTLGVAQIPVARDERTAFKANTSKVIFQKC